MKVGNDNWCSQCNDWMPFNSDGKCVKCGTRIDIKPKQHSLSKTLGLDYGELDDGDFR